MTDLSRPTLPGALPDKRQVAASFSRAAASYDSVAALQRAVGMSLLEQLPDDVAPTRWLDLGSGT
ncbi:MAG TPA: malonyl-[acyl-carrier protein] O-methyltransferase BioC, partial [Pseudomonas sp.]|nr:malonyl-[acyl-carrier protein] O-methyltransferase BioC [Pseudomonas sp.]